MNPVNFIFFDKSQSASHSFVGVYLLNLSFM